MEGGYCRAMRTLCDRLAIYEKILWPNSRTVEFSIDDGKGKTHLIKGLVKDVVRNIHDNKMEFVMEDERKHGFNLPDKVYWDDEVRELVFEYGSEVVSTGFMDGVSEAQWGESMDETLKRTAPKNHKSIIIKVIS